jgi:hypothetical protein
MGAVAHLKTLCCLGCRARVRWSRSRLFVALGLIKLAFPISIPIWLDLASLIIPTNRRRLWTGVGRANSSPSAEKCRIRDALLLWFAENAWKIERLTLSM